MLVVLSPAKNLDMESVPPVIDFTQPRFMKDATYLASTGARLPVAELKRLMKISDRLAEKTASRFKDFKETLTPLDAKPSVFAFNGDVYQGLDANSLSPAGIKHAQKYLRILSGLYGVLRPLDLMAPYRLEMGTRFQTDSASDLYGYWGDKIALSLNDDMEKSGAKTLINLASREYAKAIRVSALSHPVRTIEFREMREGKPKVISFFAKKARGQMARFIVENQLYDPQDLKAYNKDGYGFDPSLSDDNIWTFLRPDSRG